MRVDQRTVVKLLLLSHTVQAFAPRKLVVTTRDAFSSVAVPSIEQVNNEVPDLDTFDREDPACLKYTDVILDSENNPPGSLTEEVVGSVFPLLWAWGRTETEEGAQMVERLLDRLEQEVSEGNQKLELNNKHYTVAVDAWGKSGHKDSAIRAEKILQKMIEMGKTNQWLAPTRVTYNSVMNAYSKQGNADRVTHILEQMEKSPTLQPNTNDYNVLLSCFAKLGKAREAEEVLKRMVDRCKLKGDRCECAPDLYSYNILLDGWAKSNERGRGKRAEAILKAVIKQSESGDLKFQPDARTYSAAICAIVRSNEKDAIARSEEILAQAESKGIEPDEYLHTAILLSYASSDAPGSAEKAEKLLDRLEVEGVSNRVAYNTVLKAWKESTAADAASRAEAILHRMEARNLADTISYTTVRFICDVAPHFVWLLFIYTFCAS
jgi:pentatricopeptide repeat protein